MSAAYSPITVGAHIQSVAGALTRFAVLAFTLLLAVPSFAAVHYDLDVRISPAERRMTVDGQLTLVLSAETKEISLLLSRRMSKVSFDTPSGRGLGATSQPRNDDLQWTLRLSTPAPAGSSITVKFRYEGAGETANQYHIGPEVAFASAWGTNWYPVLAAGESKATARMRLVVPPEHAVVATGRRVSDRRAKQQRVVEFDETNPTYLAFASGAFLVQRHSGTRPLTAFLLRDRAHAAAWLAGADAIVSALEKEFGPYPFGEISFVEIPREIATAAAFNAASLPGVVLLNHRALDVADVSNLWEWLAHEIAHGWFPHLLSFKRPGGRFMEEALAQYGALAAVETLGGDALARTFRMTGFPADPIYSAAAYFALSDRGKDHPIGGLQPLADHRDLAYTKGSFFFLMLARKVGRDRFRVVLREISHARRFQEVEWWDFMQEVQRRSGVDLAQFYDQWLHRTGAPAWTSEWRNGAGGVELTVRQTLPAYALDLPVRIRLVDGSTIETTLSLDTEETTVIIPSQQAATTVDIDPDLYVLHRTPAAAMAPPK